MNPLRLINSSKEGKEKKGVELVELEKGKREMWFTESGFGKGES